MPGGVTIYAEEGGLMDNLKKSIMGKYNAEDVDVLLKKVRSDYEKCLKEQKDRILKLRDENKEMAQMVGKYKDNEKYIIGAITRAEETAQSIINDAEQRADHIIKKAQNEKMQIMMAIEGCYNRLLKLRQASESIYRAVSKVMGTHEEENGTIKVRPIRRV